MRGVGGECRSRGMNITYRAVQENDFDFLFDLHRVSMRTYVEATYGPWVDDWQREYYQARFNPNNWKIIQVDQNDAGVLDVQNRAEELFVVRIELLPAYQGRGIGSAVMKTVMAEATNQGKPVALRVLKVNIRARDLYQRLGFGVTGETDTHYIMAYETGRSPET